MTARFANQVVLITGGGSGIGRATALAFAQEGATVVVAGRRQDALAETVDRISRAGGTASLVTADVTNAEDVAGAVAQTVARHGGLHIAVNNAGVLATGAVSEMDEKAWNLVLATNLTGTWLSMKYEIEHMRAHGGGVIVNISSNIGAHHRIPGIGAYAAAKAGVSALTRTAALECIRDGIRINAVSPGASDTEMSRRPGESDADRAARLGETLPLGRIGALSEITGTVLWLASADAGFAVGTDVVVDGGASA